MELSNIDLTSDFENADFTAQVKQFYERFPYPQYPLLLPLRWQEAYLGSSLLAASVVRQSSASPPAIDRTATPQILLLGAGETQPAMIRRWEPKTHQITAIDLSARSLSRARWRNLTHNKNIRYYVCCLENFVAEAKAQKRRFDHVEAYGVLHHLTAPSQVLAQLPKVLNPGATLRLMVYNSESRRFLRHLKGFCRILKLSPYVPADRQFLRQVLKRLQAELPRLGTRLTQMGPVLLDHDARLADTFFHPREVYFDAETWWDLLTRQGIHPMGLYDRYGELDDLPNPLWQVPTLEEIQERTADLRMENNFELYCQWQGEDLPKRGGASAAAANNLRRLRWPTSPPLPWFQFQETKDICWSTKQKLWQLFLARLRQTGTHGPRIDPERLRLTPKAVGRLARLGALFADQLPPGFWRDSCRNPLETHMEPPDYPPIANQWPDKLQRELEVLIKKRGVQRDKLLLAMTRLFQANQC